MKILENSENSYNINIIVGILHFLLAIIIPFYGILFTPFNLSIADLYNLKSLKAISRI